MKKYTLLKIALAFVLIISIFIPAKVEGATNTYSATVSAKTADVREKASSKSKKLGTLKKGTKVTVYQKTKSGWSKIKYKKKNAYVLTKYLKFASPKTKVSYLMDPKYDYVYQIHDVDVTETVSYKEKLGDGTQIWVYGSNGDQEYRFKETKDGLYNFEYKWISYPIKAGDSWSLYEGSPYCTVKSVNNTIKTKADTFKNTIEISCQISEDYEETSYYAPEIGLVLTKRGDQKSKELIKLKKK